MGQPILRGGLLSGLDDGGEGEGERERPADKGSALALFRVTEREKKA